jgi:hypothetical protein
MNEQFPVNPNALAAYIRNLEKKVDLLAGQLSQVKIQGDLPASLPGQYSGKPIPSIEGVEIDIPAQSTARVNGNIIIAADGPFMARAVHFAFRKTSGTNIDIWRPISSASDLAVAGTDIFNFYWEYQVSGSRRNRQNIPIPSTVPDWGDRGNGFYDFLVEDVFSPTSTVSIWITPLAGLAQGNEGVLFVGFDGAYILE